MRYWDSSALVPLFVVEPRSAEMRGVQADDEYIATWRLSSVEIVSAFGRRLHEGRTSLAEVELFRIQVGKARQDWVEISDVGAVAARAETLLVAHPLRAADALQLAAALELAGTRRQPLAFVCLDDRLRTAAAAEGLTVLPASL